MKKKSAVTRTLATKKKAPERSVRRPFAQPKRSTTKSTVGEPTSESVTLSKAESETAAKRKSEGPSKAGSVRTRKTIAVKTQPVAQPTAALKPESEPSASAPKTIAARPARKLTAKIPPILLEGDRPSVMRPGGPGQRYVLGPQTPLEHFEQQAELPEAYGTQSLLLAARDPHWLYAHWDFTRQQQRDYNSRSVDGHLVVRVYLNTASGKPIGEVHVHPESRHWFIHVEHAGARYVAELGFYEKNRHWQSISTSGATLTPPETISSDTTVQCMTLPLEVPLAKLVDAVKEAVQENVPLAVALEELRASGYTELPAQISAPTNWTSEQERALAQLISMDSEQRVWIGSLEVTQLIRRQLEREISSIAAAQFGLGAPTEAAGALGSISSPFGGKRGPAKGFWFNVNAELIIYGATEPGAKVTIGERAIKLRPDGSFSFRFALPDGRYEIPATATSAGGEDTRHAGLKFSRETQYRGEVAAHRQDERLKAPLVENVG
jgi:hypothetical protein